MAGGRDNRVARLTELIKSIDEAVAGDRLNMFRTAFRRTDRRAGLQHAGILNHNALHAEVRAAAHDRPEVVRVTHVFQRQNAIFFCGLRDPLGNRGAVAFFDQEADAAVVIGPGGFRQLGFINHMIGFTVSRHPAQRLFKTRRHALNKPGADNSFRAALEQGLTGVFTIHAGLFRALATQYFRIDKALPADPAVIFFYRRLIARGAGNGTPRGRIVTMKIIALALITLAVIAFTIVTAAVSFVTRRAAAAVNTRFSWTTSPFPGTWVMGAFVRIIITADIHHFDLAAFIFQFVAHQFSPPALREARRLPDVSSLRHDFV